MERYRVGMAAGGWCVTDTETHRQVTGATPVKTRAQESVDRLNAAERLRASGRRWTLYVCHSCGYGFTEEEDNLACPRCGEPRSQVEAVEVREIEEGDAHG